MRVGIDWGGTKIEGIVLEPSTGKEILRKRVDAPKDNYLEIINKVCELINDISINYDNFTVGIGMPGSLHPETGKVQVSNTKALEGQDVKKDLENKLKPKFPELDKNNIDLIRVMRDIKKIRGGA